jgi:hypothetical protein
MKNDVKVNIEPDVKELVIRNGEAPILYPPNKIEFEGLITTPIDYFISRKGQKPDYFDLSKTLVVVEISKGIITLFGNPSDGFGDKITGRLHINPVWSMAGITDTAVLQTLPKYSVGTFAFLSVQKKVVD